MFITVKYGSNESLLCNPACAVVNLLASIKRRTGYGNTNLLLDLSDESGLVKDLDQHQYDYATKYLPSHGTFILVEKQLLPPEDTGCTDTDGSYTSAIQQYQYIPLLDKYSELFPNYKLHVQQVEKKKKARASSKSPSPAGIRGTKSKGKGSMGRVPSRKR